MDADRIRQAVETHGCDLRAKYRDEHRREEPDCAVCLIDTAALAYADWLDGPTDEQEQRTHFLVECAAKGDNIEVVTSEIVAVFRARKEAE